VPGAPADQDNEIAAPLKIAGRRQRPKQRKPLILRGALPSEGKVTRSNRVGCATQRIEMEICLRLDALCFGRFIIRGNTGVTPHHGEGRRLVCAVSPGAGILKVRPAPPADVREYARNRPSGMASCFLMGSRSRRHIRLAPGHQRHEPALHCELHHVDWIKGGAPRHNPDLVSPEQAGLGAAGSRSGQLAKARDT
jgi:hypothetical protein